MVPIFEEIKDYLESDGFIDVNITAHSYYSGNPEAIAFIAFLDELGIRWVSGKTAKEHCECVKKRDSDLENHLRIIIVKNSHAESFHAMFQFKTKQQQTHYFNPEIKELLKLI